MQNKIKADYQNSIKEKDKNKILNFRYIISEFSREKEKILSDERVLKILKQIKKKEIEFIKHSKENKSKLLDLVNSYLPKEISKEEVKIWIDKNIDFSKFKNPIQSMKIIMNHFKGSINGNVVKEILEEKFKGK